MSDCPYCDWVGSKKTYANQMTMPLNGRVRSIDFCIGHIVAALNAGGVKTYSCCCGHKHSAGQIVLADGRVLVICEDEDQADSLIRMTYSDKVKAAERRDLLIARGQRQGELFSSK